MNKLGDTLREWVIIGLSVLAFFIVIKTLVAQVPDSNPVLTQAKSLILGA